MIELPKTSAKFKAWLKSKSPRSIPCSGKQNFLVCPLDVYLREEHGVKADVYHRYTMINGHYLENPKWMKEAVRKIDLYNFRWNQITASRLLKLMEGI